MPSLQIEREGRVVNVAEIPDWQPESEAGSLILEASEADLANFAYWCPVYEIAQLGEDSVPEGKPADVFELSIRVGGDNTVRPASEGQEQRAISQAWAQASDAAIVFMAWIHEGRVVLVKRMKNGPKGRPLEGSLSARIPLALADGHPVILAWEGGRFLESSQAGLSGAQVEAFQAVARGDRSRLVGLLSPGLDINSRDERGYSLVFQAAAAGSLDCLEELILRKAKLGARRDDVLSPMEIASSLGREAIVRRLILEKQSVNGRAQERSSPLYLAAKHGHSGVVELLLAAKANTEELTHFNAIALGAAINEAHFAIAERLQKAGSHMDFKSTQNQLAVLSLCREGRMASVRYFHSKRALPKGEVQGHYALIEAARKGNEELANLLLSNGSKPNAVDDEGDTALVRACLAGNVGFVKALLKAKAKVDLPGRDAMSPLHAVVLSYQPEILSLLLQAGAPTGFKNKAELTPMDMAVIIGSWDCVRQLIEAGGQIDRSSPFFDDELESVIRGDQDVLLAQLLQKGLAPTHTLRGGWPLRRLAVLVNSVACAQLLADLGAPLDEQEPYKVVSASRVDPGFATLEGETPRDPRPDSLDLKAADVKVRVLVGGDGQACFSTIEECSDRFLCVAVNEVVKTWRFTPPCSEGKAVAVWAARNIHFPSMKERIASRPKVDVGPKPIKQAPPVYPQLLLSHGGMGEVMVGFVVNEKGKPEFVHVVRSSNYALNDSAVDCVRKWRFEPARSKGKPVKCQMQVPIIFNISL